MQSAPRPSYTPSTLTAKTFFLPVLFCSLLLSPPLGQAGTLWQPRPSHSTVTILNEKLSNISDASLRESKLQCASPWLHKTSRCRSSRTWHPVVSVLEMCTPSYAPSPSQSQLQSQLLTRIADRSENPHGRPRVSPYLSLRQAHLLFSLHSRHPQALERPLLCPMDV